MSTLTEPLAPPKAQLNRATRQLLYLAATLPCLARKMNLRLVNQVEPEVEPALQYHRNVPWLYERGGELAFDPDRFRRCIGPWSSGEYQCALFILNVWSPSNITPRWRFNLFDLVGTCGGSSEEVHAITEWMQNPIWP